MEELKMSSNHTLVSVREWNEKQRRIAATEAYIINRQEEVRRIAELIQERRREIETIRQSNQAAIQQSVATLENMFNENVALVRGRINTQLRTQTDSFGSQLQGLHSELRNTESRLSAFDQRINTLATTFNDVFQEYAEQEQNSSGRANVILNEIESLIGLIEQLNPQQFYPAEYATLISLRESIRANINAGDYQAAILVSQNSVLQATSLLARLQLANEQYSMRINAIRENVTGMRQRIETLSSKDGVLTTEIDGLVEEYDYDISFWSNGKFDTIVQEFCRLENCLYNENLTMGQLNQIAESFNVLDDNITVCDSNARQERISALIAADAALRLHNGLVNSNWNLEESGYKDGDERNPYIMSYTDAAGNTVSFVVSPEEINEPRIAMEVFSDDKELAELTKDGIHEVLEDEGLTIEGREQRDDCHLNPNSETFIENAVAEAQEVLEERRL